MADPGTILPGDIVEFDSTEFTVINIDPVDRELQLEEHDGEPNRLRVAEGEVTLIGARGVVDKAHAWDLGAEQQVYYNR